MTNTYYAAGGMIAGILLWLFGRWKESRQTLGVVPWLPPFYIQLTGLVMCLVFAADFISLSTGVTWSSPFRR